jgi:D-3-phosphoglycerate dehydrogenase
MPYSEENYHFINADRIKKIKKGSILVNAARGGLIDESALYDAIISGHLGGAALDCYEKEPYDGKLKKLENVLLTAHIGSYAKEGRVMMERQAVENLFHEFEKIGFVK